MQLRGLSGSEYPAVEMSERTRAWELIVVLLRYTAAENDVPMEQAADGA